MAYQLVKSGNNAGGIFDIYSRFIKCLNEDYHEHAINTACLMYYWVKDLKINIKLKYKLIYITLLHDVGLYERNDTTSIYKAITDFLDEHSKKSYLYIKYYTPYKDLAKIVLYHHASYKYNKLDYKYAEYAYLLHLIDRFNVAYHDYGFDEAIEHIKFQADNLFSNEQIEKLIQILAENNVKAIFEERKAEEVLREYLSSFNITNDELIDEINGLAFIYEKYDPHQIGHSTVVGFLSYKLGELLGLPEADCEILKLAGTLHDFGKIMVSSNIIKKAFKLKKEEKLELNKHVVNTLKLIDGIFADDIYQAIKYHHEAMNGTGYPFMIKDSEIPLYSKILTTANRYSVLYAKRSYDGTIDFDAIMRELYELVDNGILDINLVNVINKHREKYGLEYKDIIIQIHNTHNKYTNENIKFQEKKQTNKTAEYFINQCLKNCPYIDNSNYEYLFDNLTRTLNRATITKYLEYLIDTKIPFSIALLDVDNFKHVNDNYGHLIGDEVLVKLSQSINRAVGDIGLVGRYGGDEFMVIVPNETDYHEIWNIFHSINGEINEITFPEYDNLCVTATTGISRFPENAATYNDIISTADKALYRGKQKGRNCFIIYLEEKHKDIVIDSDSDRLYSPLDLQSIVFDKLTSDKDIRVALSNTLEFFKNYLVLDHISIENNGRFIIDYYSKTSLRNDRCVLSAEIIDDALDGNSFFATNTARSLSKKKSRLKAFMDDTTMESLIICTIEAYGKRYGILRIDTSFSKLWQNNEIELIITVAKVVGIILAITNKTLEDI